MERKLTAILSADVEGYSRLMGEDEEATIRTLTLYRQIVTPLIQSHRGRVVDSPGDNLLAEFASVVDAVKCAVVIQTTLGTKNANLPQNSRMEFRIGINLGDVIVDDDRLYGDGVNIAARMEGLAEAGGICISGTVFEHVKGKVSVSFEDIGPQQVKNISEPIRAYRAVISSGKVSDEPQSKVEVRAVEPTTLSVAGGEAGKFGLNDSLYRHTFVGRERELQQLQGAFDAALAGQGALAMVVGEPGIGKTSLCEQLAKYAEMLGGKLLIGHCYEEGSLSLPYLPFVEAMRSYVLSREPDDLRRDLGTGAADVARLVSEIRDRLQVEVRPPGDPEDDRWRLLQAVTDFLRNASTAQPLLVVLEDLHDADRGTLDLLLHVSRNLRGTRLLIIGTYRDVEVDRAHPLANALAELRRAGSFLRIPLRGLTVDEVHRMYCNIRGQEIPWSRAEAIHRQTEGNPLFVQEVLRYLVEEGIVVREGGRYSLADTEAGIPEGLRDVVGKRLSRLSQKANQFLSVASVIGREFRLDVLQQVAGLPEEELYGALEEATGRAVIEQRQALGTVGFRFNHAFFRQTLYEEIFVPRRIRLHQQVGKTLESIYSQRLEEHAAELAEHFIQSTERSDLEKALHYSELAAKRAMQVFAYGEAVRHLEQALSTQEVLDPDDKTKRCDLLIRQAEAMLPLEEPHRVADTVAAEAFQLAEETEDSPRAARAAVQACDALMRKGYSATGAGPGASSEFREWAARADRHAPGGSIERIYSDLYFGIVTMQTGGPAAGHVYYRRAAHLALELDDSAAFFAAASWVHRLNALQDYELKGQVAAESLRRPREGASARDLSVVLNASALTVFDRGDRLAAEEAWGELQQLVERTRDVRAELGALGYTATLAFVDGRLEESRSLNDSISSRAEALGVGAIGGGGAGIHPLLDGRVRYFLGESVEPALAASSDPGRIPQARRAVILSWLGRGAEVRAIRARFGDVGADTDESAVQILVGLLEASLGVGDAETAGALLRRLAPLAGHFVHNNAVSIGRLVGEAAVLLGQPEAARGYYAQALEVCERVRFRPEIALIRLDLAVLLHQGTPEEKAQAREHLEFAINEFREMKMKPALERALRYKNVL